MNALHVCFSAAPLRTGQLCRQLYCGSQASLCAAVGELTPSAAAAAAFNLPATVTNVLLPHGVMVCCMQLTPSGLV
jgi:hypothetical protein